MKKKKNGVSMFSNYVNDALSSSACLNRATRCLSDHLFEMSLFEQ